MTVVQVHETRRPIDYIQWAPDSQHILCVNFEHHRVEIRSTTDSAWQASISEQAFPFVRVRWSPDSKNIICVAELEVTYTACIKHDTHTQRERERVLTVCICV